MNQRIKYIYNYPIAKLISASTLQCWTTAIIQAHYFCLVQRRQHTCTADLHFNIKFFNCLLSLAIFNRLLIHILLFFNKNNRNAEQNKKKYGLYFNSNDFHSQEAQVGRNIGSLRNLYHVSKNKNTNLVQLVSIPKDRRWKFYTYINQIDIYQNDLAFAGDSLDQKLTTTFSTDAPIVGVIIISQPGTQFKWAKANERQDYYLSMSFSSDGKLIFAITNNGGFIMVFDSSDGTLKSSRSYSGNHQAQFEKIKSIIISSAPIAFVISKDYISSGIQMFSFDPLIFSSSPKWAKYVPNTSQNHQGITFGRTENIIYSFIYDSGTHKVSRIDDSVTPPTIFWTYGFLGNAANAAISHKQETNQDILVITGQSSSSIKYFGVLIIPTTSPFTPTTTSIYYDPSLDNNYSIQGVQITSLTSIQVIWFHSVSQQCYLTEFNLANCQYTKKETIPKYPVSYYRLGVFSSDGLKYYIPSQGQGNNFYTNRLNTNATKDLGSYFSAVIYSSDIQNAYYILSTNLAGVGILTVDTTNVIIKSTINPYNNNSGFLFTVDNSNLMRDLDLNVLNRPSWVSYQPFTINTVTQQSSTFMFQPGTSSSLSITAFSATNNCVGDLALPSFTYKGIKEDGSEYDFATDNIRVYPQNGTISVTQFLTAGTYKVQVKGILQTGISDFYTFTLTSNSLPYFNPILSDQVVNIMSTLIYTLPALTDIDMGQTAKISTVTMTPGLFYLVSVTVTDGIASTTYQFTVTVQPLQYRQFTKPSFNKRIVKLMSIPINQEEEYSLPVAMNSENLEIIHTSPLPHYSSFKFATYKFRPKLASDLGIATIKGILKNSNGQIKFSFYVNVVNQLPQLLNPPSYYKVPIGSQLNITLESVLDRKDFMDIRVETFEINKKRLPSFIYFNKETRVYTIKPAIKDKFKKYTIVIQLTDSFSAQNIYKFNVEIQQQDILSQFSKNKIEKAQFQILKVYRNAKATILISASTGVPNITSSLNNETMEFDIVNSGIESNNTQVSFVISDIDYEQGIINVQLKFADPKSVSTTPNPDQLRVRVLKTITANLTDRLVYIPIETVSFRQIPPQVTENFENSVDMFKSGNLQISKQNSINIIILFVLQIFWSQLDDMSFMFINPLISMAVPGLVQIVLAVLMNFIYFDILLTDFWLPNLFSTTNNKLEIEGGLNDYFDENGYQSKSLIKNLGSGFVYIMIYLSIVVLYLVMTLLGLLFSKFDNARLMLKKLLFWNNTLNLYFSQYPSLWIASLINLYSIKFEEGAFQKISSVASLVFMGVVPCGLVVCWWIMRKYTIAKMVESEKFQETYGTSIQEGTRKTVVGQYWRIFVCVRWTVTCCIMIFLRDYPSLQVATLLPASVLTQMVLIHSPPFTDFTDNCMTIFNEIATSFYLYLLLLLTGYHQQDHMRTHFSIALTALVCLTVGVNSIRGFQRIFQQLQFAYSYLKSKYNKIRLMRKNTDNTVAMQPITRRIDMTDEQTNVTINDQSMSSNAQSAEFFYHSQLRQVPNLESQSKLKVQKQSIKQKEQPEIIEEEKEDDEVSEQEPVGREAVTYMPKRVWNNRQMNY